jgi:TonB-dependent starch-binding outer membrane protein SusC
MKKQILLLCLALISLCGYAQQITVKGVVTSATDQQPLIGTTVQVKGTGTGTITGIDGDYTLPNVDKNAVLVFSSIGFESQEIAVGGRTTINVVLKEAAELLDEVVVIGYGAVKKSDLTSSIATVKGDEITETVTGNAMDALQGKVNGVQVTSGGGPGATLYRACGPGIQYTFHKRQDSQELHTRAAKPQQPARQRSDMCLQRQKRKHMDRNR